MIGSFSNVLAIFTSFLVLFTIIQTSLCNPLARGFGDKYDWVTLEDGLKQAAISKKPIMLIIHKSWCGACQALKPKIANAKPLIKLAKNFIMVNAEDDEEPTDPQFNVDGTYIPRILFLNSKGKVRKDIYNKFGSNSKFKYFYSVPQHLGDTMRIAMEEITEEKDAVIEALEEEARLQAEKERAEEEDSSSDETKRGRITDEL